MTMFDPKQNVLVSNIQGFSPSMANKSEHFNQVRQHLTQILEKTTDFPNSPEICRKLAVVFDKLNVVEQEVIFSGHLGKM